MFSSWLEAAQVDGNLRILLHPILGEAAGQELEDHHGHIRGVHGNELNRIGVDFEARLVHEI